MECWRSNRIALAVGCETQLVWVLFEMRDSGGFLTFPFRLSSPVSLTLADSVSTRDPIVHVSFHDKGSFFFSLSSFFHS